MTNNCPRCGKPQSVTAYCVNDDRGGCIEFGTVFVKQVA